MKKITSIRSGRGRGKRVNILLDGKFAFCLEAEVVVEAGLEVEQVLSTDQIEALPRSNHFHRCLNAAIHYLSYRMRSESELRERLHRRGFDSDTQEAVITRLKEQGLVNDMTFAQFWKDNRESFSPRSQWLTRLELRQKGIAKDIIDQVVDTIDDDVSAYRAALSKARSLPQFDYQSFRRRLGKYLKRRGFSYGVISNALERLQQDQVISPR
ncbi:regulatory protein RecX [Chloroflexota bacterium]